MKSSHLFAFLGGAAVGAAVALLMAPKSGEELRRDIKDMIDGEVDKGRREIKRYADIVSEKLDKE